MNYYYDESIKRIKWLDKRYYSTDGDTWFPSVTTILEVYPKGAGLNDWVKSLGHNADFVMQRAADEGTAVHDLMERLIKGEEIHLMDSNGNLNYKIHVWEMFMKVVEFLTRYQPEIIACEANIVSPGFATAGTIDLVCRIDGKVWLIDLKTSNSIYDTHYLQLAAYQRIWDEQAEPNLEIDRSGILWVKAQTRGEDKKGLSMQGKGWQVKECTDYAEQIQQFIYTQAIWYHQNPNFKPFILEFPTTVKLNLKLTHSLV